MAGEKNPRHTLIKAVMFYRSHFSMPPLTALEVIKLRGFKEKSEGERKWVGKKKDRRRKRKKRNG